MNENPMITALRDMLENGENICVIMHLVTKRTGIYAVDSLLQGYCPSRLSEDKDKSF